jgi:hypothetical protein
MKGFVAVRFKVTAKAAVKHNFSKQHLKAATYFAKRAAEIETAATLTTQLSEEIRSQHRAYVTGAIFSAVAALESSINELYLEAQDRNPHTLKGLDPEKIALLGQFWPEIDGYSILHKYQTALLIISAGNLDKGQSPYQNADSLIKLRNALVHYKPEWDNELDIHKKIETRLRNKFNECAFADQHVLWFPHKCLGSGCAKWSVGTITAFMHEFCQRAQIPERF